MTQNIADQRRANCLKDWGAGFASSHLYLSLEVSLSLIEGVSRVSVSRGPAYWITVRMRRNRVSWGCGDRGLCEGGWGTGGKRWTRGKGCRVV